MKNTHQVYLISDSTGETLDRIFMALKAQFSNFNYELNQFSFNFKLLKNFKSKSHSSTKRSTRLRRGLL